MSATVGWERLVPGSSAMRAWRRGKVEVAFDAFQGVGIFEGLAGLDVRVVTADERESGRLLEGIRDEILELAPGSTWVDKGGRANPPQPGFGWHRVAEDGWAWTAEGSVQSTVEWVEALWEYARALCEEIAEPEVLG